jgi:hypothetical protein
MTPEFTASRITAIAADNAYTQALATAYPNTPTWVSRYWTDHQNPEIQTARLAHEAAERELFSYFYRWNGYNPKRNAWEIVPV